MNINIDLLTRNLNSLIHKYNRLAIKRGQPAYMRPLIPPNMRANESMLRFEYGLVLRKLKRLLHQADTGKDDTRVQSVDLGVTINAFKADTDGITVDKWTYSYDSTAQIIVAQFTGTATGELELKLSDMPAEECKFTGGESLPVDRISFSGCSDLTELTLRKWDLGDIDDMSYMFEGCSSMITVDGIQNWDTSKINNMESIFDGCASLSSVNALSKWDTSKVENMKGLFDGCELISSFGALISWDTSNTTDMSYMFNGCSSMTTIDGIQNWDTGKVEDMSYMFYKCSDLSEFGSNTWNTSSVKKMNGTFRECRSLTKVEGIQNWDTSSVKELNNTFSGCKELTAIDLSKWDTSLVTDTTNMLLSCDKLDSLTINSSVYDTFMSATDLGIDLDNWYYLSTSVGSTNSWSELGVEDEAATIVPYQTTILRYAGLFESLRTDIISGSFKYSFTTDITGDGQVFKAQLADKASTTPPTDAPYMVIADNNNTLVPVASYANICDESDMEQTIDVSEWNTRNVNNLSMAFSLCNKLEKIDGLDKWNTSKVKSMSGTFAQTYSIPNLNGIRNWDTSKVEDMNTMFIGNSDFYFSYASKWDTSNIRTAARMFMNATNINALMLNSWRVRDDISIPDMFKGMTSLHALTITESMFNQLRNSTDSGIAFIDWYYGSTKIGTQSWSDLGLNTPTAATFTKYVQNEKKLDGGFANDDTSIDIDNWRYYGYKYDESSDTWQYLSVVYLGKTDSGLPTTKPYTSIRASDNTALTVDLVQDMFAEMTALTTADMSGWRDYMLQVIDISSLFRACRSLTSVNVTGLWHNTMVYANTVFGLCTALTEIIGLDTWMNPAVGASFMRSLRNFFAGCSSLTQISGISSWDISSLIDMSYMFNGCSSLVLLDLGGWDIRDDANISDIFDGCTALTSIRIKKSASRLLTQLPGKITDWYIRLPISYAKLTSAEWNAEWGSDEPRIFYKYGPSIYTLDGDFPATGTSLTIGSWSYYFGGTLFSASIADKSVTSIPSDMPYNYIANSSEQIALVSFSDLCNDAASLTDVSALANLPVSYTTGLNGMFSGCTSLKTITSTANWDVRGVSTFNSMFATANIGNQAPSVLETVDLSGWDLTTQNPGLWNFFAYCDKLKSVKISKTGAKILTVLPGEITKWKVNGIPLTDTNWNTSWGNGPIELKRDVA